MTQQKQHCVLTDESIKANDEARRKAGWLIEPQQLTTQEESEQKHD